MNGLNGGTGKPTRSLECPFCGAFQVDRLYLGTACVDLCTCAACGARWDQDARTGELRGRGSVDTVFTQRNP